MEPERQVQCSNIEMFLDTLLLAILLFSGLCSAKHSLDQGYKVTVYEQAEQIGGTWVYTDKIGKDKYGVRIHTSMYQGLRYLFNIFHE